MDFGTFSERAMDFSEGEIGSFGGFMLILFRASDENRICCVLSLYPWSCRFVRPWFCRGLSVMEKEVGHIFGFSGLQQRR